MSQQISGFDLLFSGAGTNNKKSAPDTNASDNIIRATENFRQYIEDKITQDNKDLDKARREIKEASELPRKNKGSTEN